MKKQLKIVWIFNITILYCFIVSIFSGNVLNSNAVFSKPTNTQGYISVDASNLLSHAVQTESSFVTYLNIPRTTLKNSFNQFSASSVANSQLLFNLFVSFRYYSENAIIRFKKTDIIFPFHCFW